MTGARVAIDGVGQLRAHLGDVADGLGDLSTVNAQIAQLVARTARDLAPKRTGKLAASVRVSKGPRQVTVRADAVYAGPIHWGWHRRHIKANPFITVAAQRTEERWTALLTDAVQDLINT